MISNGHRQRITTSIIFKLRVLLALLILNINKYFSFQFEQHTCITISSIFVGTKREKSSSRVIEFFFMYLLSIILDRIYDMLYTLITFFI